MQPEAKKLLWDVRAAAAQVELVTAGRDLEDYLADAMLRSAVERQLEIVGEACSRLARIDGETASRVPEITRIIAFRNVLAHGYASVDDRIRRDRAAARVGEPSRSPAAP